MTPTDPRDDATVRAGRIAAGFAAVLAPFDVESLDALQDNVCGLWEDLRIGYVNPAWRAFAVANGAEAPDASCGLEVNVLSVVPDVLRPVHDELFANARARRVVTTLDYQCSSPTLHRMYRMRIHPCDSGAFVVVHSLLRQMPHESSAFALLEESYRDANGFILQCSNCRHVRRRDGGPTAEWDWLPAYVAKLPEKVSHGLCPLCFAFYYPPAR